MATGSWISSKITTSGISDALLSRSIWLAKLDRYNCRSWAKSTKRHITVCTCRPMKVPVTRIWLECHFLLPCMIGGACWKRPQCCLWFHGHCGPPGTQPAGRQGRFYRSRLAQTGWDDGVLIGDWCSVASWVWEWESQIPGCPHISLSNLEIIERIIITL